MSAGHREPDADTATDVLVVGGGAAGLTASLVLARARHHVTLLDDRTYRNLAVEEFHGFPTRDATAPARFRADAARELEGYRVTIVDRAATTAVADADGVTVTLDDGRVLRTAAVLLATGVHDELPTIDGLAERWGRSAFNCPFCDGWEHRDRPVVVIDAAPGADHLASLLRSWTAQVDVLPADAVAAFVGEGDRLDHVLLHDGTSIAAAAAFVKAPVRPRNALARALRCALDPDGYVVTDQSGATSHPLVWAAGDLRRPAPAPHQVVLAAADGSAAAIAMHKAFVAGNLPTPLSVRAPGSAGR